MTVLVPMEGHRRDFLAATMWYSDLAILETNDKVSTANSSKFRPTRFWRNFRVPMEGHWRDFLAATMWYSDLAIPETT